MTSWTRVPLGEVVDTVAMGPFGSSIKVETFQPDGIPIISGTHLRGSRVDDGPGHRFISVDHANSLSRANVRRGDVIVTHAGTLGQVAVVPDNSRYERYIISQRQFYIRCNRDKLTPEYLTYYLLSPEGQHQLLANASFSGVPSIAQPSSYTKRISVPLPSVSEQCAIAEVLGALDDKIAANTKLADVYTMRLEMEANKLWFRGSGSVHSVSEYVDINPRTPKPSEPEPVYVDMKRLPERGFGIDGFDKRAPKSGTRFVNGDTLLARITPCLENRKTGYVDFLAEGQVGTGSTEFVVLRPRQSIPSVMGYFLAVNPTFRRFAIQRMVGTSGRQRVPVADLADYRVPSPDKNWLTDFAVRAESGFAYVGSLSKESRSLAALRDALLPELMSGRLRVKDAERTVEEVI